MRGATGCDRSEPTYDPVLWGGQSWPQPPFRRLEPAESRLRAELPALQALAALQDDIILE